MHRENTKFLAVTDSSMKRWMERAQLPRFLDQMLRLVRKAGYKQQS